MYYANYTYKIHTIIMVMQTSNICIKIIMSFPPFPAITYTPNYKKTPPPVPPRTTSKPLISITAQSSTESTQDAYHEGRHPRGGMWAPDGLSLGLSPGRALYNSTDSLDSTKAVTVAMEAAGVMAGKRHPSTDSHSSVLTCDKAILVSKAEEYLKTPRSSIGIQVSLVSHRIVVVKSTTILTTRTFNTETVLSLKQLKIARVSHLTALHQLRFNSCWSRF